MKILITKLSFSALALILSFLMFTGCTKSPEILDPEKAIISLSLKKADGSNVLSYKIELFDTANRINVTVPWDTDLSALVPIVEFKGVTISPASGTVVNFTLPVVYTVTAEDGSKRNYMVYVLHAPKELGTIFVGNGQNYFSAIDAATGLLKWQYKGTKTFSYSTAAYADSVVFAGGIDGNLYAFSAFDGELKWKYAAGADGIESDAVVSNGIVYFGCNDDYLYALNAKTGTLKWRFQTGGNVSASPVLANGVVYFGSSDARLYALDAITGQLKWSYSTGGMINQSDPAISDGLLYAGSRDGYVYCLNAADGTLKWRFSGDGISFEQSGVSVSNGIVYIGSWYDLSDFNRPGKLYAINAITGTLTWSALPGIGISSTPVVAEGKVFVTSDDNKIHAFDAVSGNQIWEQLILANGAIPAVSNGIVYIGGGGNGYFYAFNAANGQEKWRYATPNGLRTSRPLIVEKF